MSIHSTNNSMNRNTNSTKSNHDEKIISATAGEDTWKTWSGRKEGTANFELLDVVRGMKRTIRHSCSLFRSNTLPSVCPICLCGPESTSATPFWHVTYCGHAVCLDCYRHYAQTQVEDTEHTGPLHCPVCLKTLRTKDAMIALEGNSQLIQQWDQKIRDQLLRAVPSFRSCPNCENGGGGFVTPECLEVHHMERRNTATNTLQKKRNILLGVVAAYLVVIVGSIVTKQSSSPLADLLCIIVPLYVVAKIMLLVPYKLALTAQEQLYRPIAVGCPCCTQEFVLPVESAEHFNNDETARWISSNTRPCPSCSVPIIKRSGCNHMTCSHCKAEFCWACMRLRTTCRAYKCLNGGQYGNADPLGDIVGTNTTETPQRLRPDGSITSYIDHILNNQRWYPDDLTYRDALLIVVCLFARHLRCVQVMANTVTPIIVTIYGTLLSSAPIILFAHGCIHHYLQTRNQRGNNDGDNNNNNNNNNTMNHAQQNDHLQQQRLVAVNPDHIETLNQNMLADAIQRSIDDQ